MSREHGISDHMASQITANLALASSNEIFKCNLMKENIQTNYDNIKINFILIKIELWFRPKPLFKQRLSRICIQFWIHKLFFLVIVWSIRQDGSLLFFHGKMCAGIIQNSCHMLIGTWCVSMVTAYFLGMSCQLNVHLWYCNKLHKH